MPATAKKKDSAVLTIERRSLLAALQQAVAVVSSRAVKPILAAVRLQTRNEWLRIDATDGEIQFTTRIEAQGLLPPIVVNCADLLARVKAGKQADCSLSVKAKPARLVINGGAIEHTLNGLDLGDFPPVAENAAGTAVHLDTAVLCESLRLVAPAVGRETSRYAVTGILFESDEQGTRLVATDGRRLAIAGLGTTRLEYQGQTVLPARFAKLVEQFADDTECVTLLIEPKRDSRGEPLPDALCLDGETWQLCTTAVAGRFLDYRTVLPPAGSRFAVERKAILEALPGVALATDLDSKAVVLSFGQRRLEITAESPTAGVATAKLPCEFLGGGDSAIRIGFNPAYLVDALKTLPSGRVIFELQQNSLDSSGVVVSKVGLITSEQCPALRWVIMPIAVNLLPTRENLGSNFKAAADAA